MFGWKKKVNGLYTRLMNEIELDDYFFNAKKYWLNSNQEIKKQIRAWSKQESMKEFVKQAQKRFCESEIFRLEHYLDGNRVLYIQLFNDSVARSLAPIVHTISTGIKKRIQRHKSTIEFQNSSRSDFIDDSDIARAKEYPLSELLEIGQNGRAKCCFHNGSDFNLGIKNNFAFCFVCGEHGDSIKIYQTLHCCGFIEAVRALS
jgi:hypothetical protein